MIIKLKAWVPSIQAMFTDVDFNHTGLMGMDWDAFVTQLQTQGMQPDDDGTIYTGEDIETREVVGSYLSGEDYIWMEGAVWLLNAGLKDKNGVEIYEGDIICDADLSYVIRYGTWYLNEWELIGFFLDGKVELGQGPIGECDSPNISIIGNIYQNPELLK